MSIPTTETVVLALQKHLGAYFSRVPGKQVLFVAQNGDNERIALITPQSKLHKKGHGWFDITRKQKTVLDDASSAILAFRLEGEKVYYVNYSEFESYLDERSMVFNKREGEHWKLYLWPDFIKVRGNENPLAAEPNKIERLG
jgi:hypothetical protein